jgi:hypothetical protein
MSFETDTRLDMFADWVNVFPSPMDGWIRDALSGFENLLKDIAGDPDELSRLHSAWLLDQEVPRDLAQEEAIHRGSLLPSWDAASRADFDARLADLETELPLLGENFGTIAELLKQSGEAAIATVNAIVDVLVALLTWALAEAFIALASSVVTFGASVAAWFGSAAIKFGIGVSRAAALVTRLEGIIVTILAAIEGVAVAVAGVRSAGAVALLALKAAPTINKATDTAGGLP